MNTLPLEYRRRLENELGVPLPAPNTTLPEDFEVQLSRLTAQAAQQLLAKNTQQFQRQQNQQVAQDPIVQMQQMELKLKAQKEERQAATDQANLALKQQAQQQQMMMEKERLATQERISNMNNQTKLLDTAAKLEGQTK